MSEHFSTLRNVQSSCACELICLLPSLTVQINNLREFSWHIIRLTPNRKLGTPEGIQESRAHHALSNFVIQCLPVSSGEWTGF